MKLVEKSLEQYINALSTFSCLCTPEGIVVYASNSVIAAVGLSDKQVVGQHIKDIFWQDYEQSVQDDLISDLEQCQLEGKKIIRQAKKQVKKDVLSTAEFIFTPLNNEQGTIEYLVIEGRDVSQLIAYEEQLQKLKQKTEAASENVQIDPLTQVHNRRGFVGIISPIYSQAIRHQHGCSLFMLDIDNFKSINDQYGHQTGDKVIKFLAELLNDEVRNEDLICRWGGDEFLIFSSEINQQDSFGFAERMRKKLESESIKSLNMIITVSVGIYNGIISEKLDNLVSRAEKAMNKAKYLGKNCTKIY